MIAAEAGQPLNGAAVVDQWIEYNNDDTVRGRAYVEMGSSAARLRFPNVDGGSGGNAAVEVRYSSGYGVFTLRVTANGTTRSAALPLLGNDPGWRHTNWGRVRFENVPLNPGATNTVELSTSSSFPNISIDEIVVSNADDLAAAQPHRQALALAASELNELVAYLNQLDGSAGAAPAPTATPPRTTAPTHTHTPTATALPAAYTVAGSVHYFGGGAAVANADISLQGGSTTVATTAANGAYSFADVAAGNWTLRAAKQGATGAALSPLDAAWALQASVGNRVLSPLQALACDVTGNGSVTPFDAAHILQRLVDLIPRFPVAAACGSDWVFVPAAGVTGGVAPAIENGNCTPATIEIQGLAAAVSSAHFAAAAFGDCTLNGAGTAATLAAASDDAEIRFGAGRRRGRRYLRLPLYLHGAAALRALDVTLAFSPESLRFVGMRRGRGARGALTASREISPGRIRAVLAAAPELQPDGAPLLIAVFARRDAGNDNVRIVAADVDDRPVQVRNRRRGDAR